MISFLVIILISISNICQGNTPEISCQIQKPFKLKDNKCSSFSDVCIKNNDANCVDVLNACKGCPPSNYSVIMFMDMQIFKEQLSSTKNELELMKVQQYSMKNEIHNNTAQASMVKKELENIKEKLSSVRDSNKNILVILLLIIIVMFVLMLGFVIEMRFRFLDKLFRRRVMKIPVSEAEPMLELRDYEINDQSDLSNQSTIVAEIIHSKNVELIDKIINLIDSQLKMKIDPVLTKIDEIIESGKQDCSSSQKLEFQMPDDITKEFVVNINDNVIKIKSQLCNLENEYNCKMMQLEYNGNVLDNNQYLLSYINPPNITVKCKINLTINPDDIVILKLINFSPKFLQISKYKKISELKKIISELNNDKEIMIFKDNDEREELKDDGSVESYIPYDNACLHVISKQPDEYNLTMKSIYDMNESCSIKYSISDPVLTFQDKLAEQLDCVPNMMVFLFNEKKLEKKSIIFQINIIGEESVVYYCNYKKSNHFDIGKLISKGSLSEIYDAKNKNENLIVKKYEMRFLQQKAKNYMALVIMRSHERFVQLSGIFKDNNFFYVAMEKFSKKSLADFIPENYPIEKSTIVTWSKQILEGLKYLHDKGYCYNNLKPSSILVDENNNIKLCSFTNYLHDFQSKGNQVIVTNEEFKKYLSPEAIKDKEFGPKSDVWSFGLVLVFIITREKTIDIQTEILKFGKIDQLLSPFKISADLKYFTNSCLICNPETRASVDKLMGMAFLKD